jgi:hypothetical protein
MLHFVKIHLSKTIGPASYGVGQVALNLPKAQLDLGMAAELWSVDSLAVAEKAADAVGLAKSCLRPYPRSWPGFLHYSREMEVAAAEVKMQPGIAFVVLEKTLWVITNRFSAPWWLPRWISLSVNKKFDLNKLKT